MKKENQFEQLKKFVGTWQGNDLDDMLKLVYSSRSKIGMNAKEQIRERFFNWVIEMQKPYKPIPDFLEKSLDILDNAIKEVEKEYANTFSKKKDKKEMNKKEFREIYSNWINKRFYELSQQDMPHQEKIETWNKFFDKAIELMDATIEEVHREYAHMFPDKKKELQVRVGGVYRLSNGEIVTIIGRDAQNLFYSPYFNGEFLFWGAEGRQRWKLFSANNEYTSDHNIIEEVGGV